MATRRDILRSAASMGLVTALGPRASARVREEPAAPTNLKQSVCRWPFSDIADKDFYPMVRDLGFGAVDLLHVNEWAIARDHGLICSMGYPTDRNDFIRKGLNDRANHAELIDELRRTIPLAKQNGVPNIIAMAGNRDGKSDEEGLANCVEALDQVKGLAESEGVTVCLELLNSKVDHLSFGLALMYAVNSPRVRILYDIYHMQIMDGDIIRTIRDHGQWLAHYHTAGNPGRHELDPTQELNYWAVGQALAASGFDGWIAHEFIPTRSPREGLAAAKAIVGGTEK